MDDLMRNTIDKWLITDTHNRLVDAHLENTPINNLCLTGIPVVRTYCQAVLQLIAPATPPETRILPAMALLRIVGELVLRTCWCLTEPDPDGKVRRWLKASLMERKKLLEETVTVNDIPESDRQGYNEEVQELEKEINALKCEPAKKLWKCIDALSGEHKAVCQGIYRFVYSPFNRAVHPDILVLEDTVRSEGNRLRSIGDLGHISPSAIRKSCLDMVFHLTMHVWTYFDWDKHTLEEEYAQITAKLDNKEEP